MPKAAPATPTAFLEVRVRDLAKDPTLTVACAGYEANKWRGDALAKHAIHWLPEFCLRYREWNDLRAGDATEKIVKAAQAVYSSRHFKRRGELGELLLHIILRQEFGTTPAISKFFYKDAPNDTVKGFDSVHVVGTSSRLELWLGEVKFYSSLRRAARDVCVELRAHSKRDYLRTEFAAITNKLDGMMPFYKRLKKLMHPNTSLDTVFDAVTIPVLLTYKSRAVRNHKAVNTAFENALRAEVSSHYDFFCGQPPPKKLKIHLILLPMASKTRLMNSFDEALRTWQKIA